jgi:antirestriction protein ArdC
VSTAIYTAVTARIIEALARGVVPWRKPWNAANAIPCNAVSLRSYRGINVLLLGLSPYSDPRWMTFRQAKELGGSVRKGEKATTVVFWKPLEFEKVDFETGELHRQYVPLLRCYQVFNREQIEGSDLPSIQTHSVSEREKIKRAEAMIRAMPNPPRIKKGGSVATYKPSDDEVHIPGIGTFTSPDTYYATLFHELGHSTGHERRLNRPGVNGEIQFGSARYSREELVAELTSAFCCARSDLDNSLIEDAASYIKGWLDVLKVDSKAIVIAAAQAQKAADYILRLETPSEATPEPIGA